MTGPVLWGSRLLVEAGGFAPLVLAAVAREHVELVPLASLDEPEEERCASGVMIGRSHASPAIEPVALTAAADEVTCSSETRQRQPWLPNDWSLSSD